MVVTRVLGFLIFGILSFNGPAEIFTMFRWNACPRPLRYCTLSDKYRTIDGSCNNLFMPTWGMANTSLLRLLPARYADGVSSLRVSKSGRPLPLARVIRTMLFPEREITDPIHSLIVMTWGQIITHDTSLIATNAAPNCCTKDGRMLPAGSIPARCLIFQFPENDPFYSQFNRTCAALTRSGSECPTIPKQQMTMQTSFIDASLVYGSSKHVADGLRQFERGKLRTSKSINRPFLPTRPCGGGGMAADNICFVAGDSRVNQQPQLTTIQNVLLREHNLLCKQLLTLNPHWSDERTYQEARRLVIAQVQHITYNEYLPVILGKQQVHKFDLQPVRWGYNHAYDSNVNPGTLNSFTTAAFRSFHSLIQGTLELYKEDTLFPVSTMNLTFAMTETGLISENDNYDQFLRGLVRQGAQKMDKHHTDQITNFLFSGGRPFGQDLITIDIMRGRDHGLPTYNDFRALCGLRRGQKFSHFGDTMSLKSISELQRVYEHVDDVDLYAGGLMEHLIPGSLVGPIFQCIITEQFLRWRNGDRFFYEFGGFPGSFRLNQLNEIHKTSLSLLLCRNGDNIKNIQVDSFRVISERNPLVNCRSFRQLDLRAWKE